MKKILFPTDFSKVAENAFLHALHYAKAINAELLLLHTYELPIVDNQFVPQNYKDIFDSLELSQFEKFKDEIPKLRLIATQNGLEHVRMNHLLRDGDLIYNIKEVIKTENIDLVIMGTSGAEGWKETFLGTNTGEVLLNINVPILSIPKETKFAEIKNICLTTRYRSKDREVLREVLKFAKALNAKVKCLYVKTKVSDNTEATFNDWSETFKNDPVTFYVLPNEDVRESITDFLTSQEIDIIVMTTYKRGFFESFFSSSLTEKIINTSQIPVLAYHD